MHRFAKRADHGVDPVVDGCPAGALGATGLLPRRTYAATKGGTKLNCVQIGCGGRGRSHLDAVIVKNAQNLYALVEPDV